MPDPSKTVFISYRRSVSASTARLIFMHLREFGYDVFMDVASIDSGTFDTAILNQIASRAHFLVILEPGTLERCNEPGDWLRREIEYAMAMERNIVPVMMERFQFEGQPLTGKLADLPRYNALPLPHYFFDAAIEMLRTRFLKQPVSGQLVPVPQADEPAVKQLQNLLAADDLAAPHPTEKETAPAPPRDKNQAILLQKVRQFWVEGVLKPAKIGDVWLDLPAEDRPEAVEPQARRELKHPDFSPIPLSSGTEVADVFRRTGRALLILGAPGSGKTMTLLELAQALLDEAEQQPRLPVPVVMNLASWAVECPDDLAVWLVERLFSDYGVPRKLAERWLGDGDLLFLLDGLDEVPAQHREACVTAINRFWQRAGDWADNGIVVCSRIAEYDDLAARLSLAQAITLLPIPPTQAAHYLETLGSGWDGLRAALLDDPVLQSFATSPLMLNIMAVAYQGVPREQLVGFVDQDTQQRHLFDHYVARRLRDDKAHPRYTHTQLRHYLAWLAQQLVRHDTIVFTIESLQPTWLIRADQLQRYRRLNTWIVAFIVSSIVGIVVGTAVGLVGGAVTGLVTGLVIGIGVGIVFGMAEQHQTSSIIIKEKFSWSWPLARQELPYRVKRGLIGGFVSGIVGGLGGGLVVGLFADLFNSLLGGLAGGLLIGLAGGLGGGLVSGLTRGLQGNLIELHTHPNQGIRRSATNALRFSLLTGLAVGLVVGLIVGLGGGVIFGLKRGLYVGFLFVSLGGLISLVTGALVGLIVGGLVGSLGFGGRAVLQHIILRHLLYRSGIAPRNYAEFLHYTTSRHLTRQVGGGFIFRHRLLMEHFANSDW